MHVLIYNPVYAGHHLNWVKLMVRAISPFARRITFATTSRSACSPDYAQHLRGMSAAFSLDDSVAEVELSNVRFEGLRTARRAWVGLAGAIQRNQPDHVFAAYGDQLSLAPLVTTWKERDLGMAPHQIDAIFLRSGEAAYHRHLRLRRRVRAYLGLLGLHRLPFGRMMFIDPLVHDWLHDKCPSLSRRCALLPDPVSPVGQHEKPTARRMLGLPNDGRLICCAGILDERKGVDEFVRSFASAPLAGTDRLLLAGRASPEVAAAVHEVAPRIGTERIICINRILSDQELDLAVSAADLVAATYRFPEHLGSASLVIRAAAAGRPVLASEQGWLGHVTRTYSLGWLYPTLAAGRADSIAQSLKRSVGYIPGQPADQFARFHAVDPWAQIVTAPFRGAQRTSEGLCTPPSSVPDRGRQGGAPEQPGRPDAESIPWNSHAASLDRAVASAMDGSGQ